MLSRIMAWFPLILALLFGLGIPRAFTLLYVVLFLVIWFGHQRLGPRPPGWLRWSILWLVIFGIAYSWAQLGWGVWIPLKAHLPEIAAVVVLPSAALYAGWILPRFGSINLSRLLLAYATGALVYALISLAMSRTPWWDLSESFQLTNINVRVPWGSHALVNIRSVEQRAFPALACFPLALPQLLIPRLRLFRSGLLLLGLSILAGHLSWAYQGRIALIVLGVASLPLAAFVFPRFHWFGRFIVISLATTVIVLLARLFLRIQFCDERWWLQQGFIRHAMNAPWGGRLIQFSYPQCNLSTALRFGPIVGSDQFSPHSVLLDIWNDAGWLATVAMLLAIMPIIVALFRGFVESNLLHAWLFPLALRWSMITVLIVQWIVQPFLYSDQLMFVLGFMLVGALSAEFAGGRKNEAPT